MQDIYDYLKQKLKEKNVRVDDIVTRSGVSRTTVYRMMKGLLKPTPPIYKLFVEMLDFDDREKYEFERYVKLIDVDECQLRARVELGKMIFKTPPPREANREGIECVVYGEEKLIKKYDEILNLIRAASKHPSFKMEAKVLNCVKDTILEPVVNLLSSVEGANSYNIEHLISFSANDIYSNILTLKAVIPLLKYDAYAICFSDESVEGSNRALFEDFMLIRYSYAGEGDVVAKHIVFAFEEHTLSDCYITDVSSLYEFLYKRFKHVKENYMDIQVQQANLDWFNDFCYEFETGGQCCLLKASPCYHRIPAAIFASILKRLSETERAALVANLGEKLDTAYNLELAAETILANLTDRNNLSLKYNQIDIFTKSGLEAFAKTRKLDDHYAFLPAFTKEEIEEILMGIQSKNDDPTDKYRFHITNLPMSNDRMAFYASKKNGVIIEHFGDPAEHGEASSCWIKQEAIAHTFWDFAENFVPENLAMGKAEADEFIKYLIDTYCR